MLELININKRLGEFSLDNINIQVKRNEYYVILGISGAGKSVLLEMIAGISKPDSGQIILSGKDITNEKVQKRNIGIVFQDFAVFPHMTVLQNIVYPLRNINTPRSKAKEIATHYSKLMGIEHLLDRMPSTLSGGEQQRLALARTLVLKPDYLLLDEPLSSVDVQLKADLRSLLRKIHRMGITILHVTHDYEEAISLAEHVAVIYEGKIIQKGTSKEVFHNPNSKFLASFTGNKNFYNVEQKEQNLFLAEGKIHIHHLHETDAKYGFLLFRSEDVIVSNDLVASSSVNNFEGVIVDLFPSKQGIELIIDIGIIITAQVTHKSVNDLKLKVGKNIWVSFKSSAVKFIPKE